MTDKHASIFCYRFPLHLSGIVLLAQELIRLDLETMHHSPEKHPDSINFCVPRKSDFPCCNNENPVASTIDRLHSLHSRWSCYLDGMVLSGVKEQC